MKKKICIKILKITLLMSLFFIIANNNCCLAMGDVTSDRNWTVWRPSISGESELINKTAPILGILRVIGIIVSVATLAFIGIKFVFGSVEAKANYKQVLLPWVIGATMLFAITTIPSVIYDLTQNITSSESIGERNYDYIDGYDDFIIEASQIWENTRPREREERFQDFFDEVEQNALNNQLLNSEYYSGRNQAKTYLEGVFRNNGLDKLNAYIDGYMSVINDISEGNITESNVANKYNEANRLWQSANEGTTDKFKYFAMKKRLWEQKERWGR